MTYADEVCTACGERCAVLLLDDHGHVHAAACAQHRGSVISASFTPALYLIEAA